VNRQPRLNVWIASTHLFTIRKVFRYSEPQLFREMLEASHVMSRGVRICEGNGGAVW
jgi:hypothetical protein